MMMSYIGINPDEFHVERYTGDDFDIEAIWNPEILFNDPKKKKTVGHVGWTTE